jgi:hypothetical protein
MHLGQGQSSEKQGMLFALLLITVQLIRGSGDVLLRMVFSPLEAKSKYMLDREMVN